MKRKIIVGVCLFIGIIVFICYLFYPKIAFLKALSNFRNLNSVHLEGSLTLGNDNFELNLDGNANYNDGSFYSQLTTNYLWNTLKISMYFLSEENERKFYLTTNFSDNWFVSKMEKKENNTSKKNISLKDIQFQKVKTDRKGSQKFKLLMSKDLFLSFFSDISDTIDYEEDTVLLYLYIKNQKITGVVMDKGKKLYLSKDSNLYLENVDLEISSWNSVSDITIPENIPENSKNLTEENLSILSPKES